MEALWRRGGFRLFLGMYTPKLDEKGCLVLPVRFRETLEGGLVVARTRERAFTVYPKDTFEALMAPASTAPPTPKQACDYQRMLAAGASFEAPDRQGRITIPPVLRSYAGLERDAVVIGAINRAEIWDAEHWAEYQAEQKSGFTELDVGLLSQLGQ